MPASLSDIIGLLDLEQLEVGLYRGSQPIDSSLKRVFGGQVAAQALMAAQLTVPHERHVHSLHLYFILGGDPSIPIVYDVENVRDGRSFTTRRVAARQHGEIIFYMTASFQVEEPGWDHQDAMPSVPTPEESTPMTDIIEMQGPEAVAHRAGLHAGRHARGHRRAGRAHPPHHPPLEMSGRLLSLGRDHCVVVTRRRRGRPDGSRASWLP